VRLPWPFGRSEAAPADPEPTPEATASLAPPTLAPPTGAWSSLPPIQRVSGEPPVVAPAGSFLADVPGARPLPPIVGQLGHDVTPLAPSGLVAAPSHAVASLTSSAALVDRPVQRQAAAAGDAAEPEPEVVQRSAASSAATAASAPSAAGPSATIAEPLRQLSVVAPGAAADAPSRSLTRVEAWTPPAGGADRPLAHRTNVQTSSTSSTSSAASRPASPATSSAPAPTVATPVPPASSAGSAASPRRPGLGAPLTAPPTTAVQRAPDRMAPLAGTIQRRGAAARTSEAAPTGPDGSPALPIRVERAGSPQAPYVGSRVAPALPSLPVVARTTAAAPAHESEQGPASEHAHDRPAGGTGAAGPTAGPMTPASPGAGPRPTTAAVNAQRSAASTASPPTPSAVSAPARPLVGARPLLPSTTPSSAEPQGAETPAAPPGPLVAQGMPSDLVPVAAATWVNPNLAALTGPEPALPALQRSPSAARSAMAAKATAAPLALSAAGPAVQTSRREPQMTLARPAAASPAQPSAAFGAPIAYAAGAGQVPGIVATPGAPMTVQMTPAQALQTPVLAPTATAVVQRADAAPGPSPAPSEPDRSDGELEELARALFPRFQRQLRMEYVYEREARGLPYDS